jgi:hypothetical protein
LGKLNIKDYICLTFFAPLSGTIINKIEFFLPKKWNYQSLKPDLTPTHQIRLSDEPTHLPSIFFTILKATLIF